MMSVMTKSIASTDETLQWPMISSLEWRNARANSRCWRSPVSFDLQFHGGQQSSGSTSPNAVVISPGELPLAEKKAIDMLLDEVESRTQIRFPVVKSWPKDQFAIVIGSAPALKSLADDRGILVARTWRRSEGYRLWSEPSSVWVMGNDARGVLFGVGRLLREMRMSRQSIRLPSDLHIDSAPQTKIRGHQLGYRPKTNSYDGWTVALWEQYIRDLAVFGCNTIELIPPRSDDDADSPHFPLPQIQMMSEMSRLADEYGLDVWIWYPAMDDDYSKPATVDFCDQGVGERFREAASDRCHLRSRRALRSYASRIPLRGSKQAAACPASLEGAIWLSPQSFDQKGLDEFFELLRQEPSWLTGIVYGPQVRIPLSGGVDNAPTRYPIRNYPDITHVQHCQYPASGITGVPSPKGHETPITAQPTQMANIFRRAKSKLHVPSALIPGCNDDVNKMVFQRGKQDPTLMSRKC